MSENEEIKLESKKSEKGDEYLYLRKTFNSLIDEKGMSLSAMAITCLLKVIENSSAQTIHGLRRELIEAQKVLVSEVKKKSGKYTSSISLISGCELFIRTITRQSYKEMEISKFKKNFLERGKKIAKLSIESKSNIAKSFEPFIEDDVQILLIGYSSVAINVLLHYKKKRFDVIIPEGRPDGMGYMSANILANAGIPTTIICDTSIAHLMHKIDFVICGAEGVVENGGIINKIGTYQTALIAKAHKVPFYVTVESFKFVRKFFLNQKDMKQVDKVADVKYFPLKSKEKLSTKVKILNPISDFTPPDMITFLITDLGVMTPSGISDELIKLYS